MGTVTTPGAIPASSGGAERSSLESLDTCGGFGRYRFRRRCGVVVVDQHALADGHEPGAAHRTVRRRDAMLCGHAGLPDPCHPGLHRDRLAVESRRTVDHPGIGQDEARLTVDAEADGLIQDLLEV